MKKKRHSVEQITQFLRQAESGAPVGDLTLDKVMLQDVVKRRVVKPVRQREVCST